MEQLLRTLVAFGTRNTLSETSSASRGIGAARHVGNVTEYVLPRSNIDDRVFGVAALDAGGHESTVSAYVPPPPTY
jgi:hypothetical protein